MLHYDCSCSKNALHDLKLFRQSERDIESILNTFHRSSYDIGMQFDKEKCSVNIMKRGRTVTCDRIQLQDGEKMK